MSVAHSGLQPSLDDAPRPATFEVDAQDEHGRTWSAAIAGEHALTLYLDERELTTVTTLGAAPAHLALGYLRNQRIVEGVRQIASVQVDWDKASVAITSRALADLGRSFWQAAVIGGPASRASHHIATTSTRDIAVGKLNDDLDRISLSPRARLTEATLYTALEQVHRHASIYEAAGAVQRCALCSNAGGGRPEILRLAEDVHQERALDAIAGWMWMEDMPGADKLIYTTGPLSAEMVVQCARLEIPFLVSRCGLTREGWELARRVGMTLLGQCHERHYLLFTGAERFVRPQTTAFA